ncbi:MAG TPA: T9SS type A sorting domain-containing protein [Candidatus Eisenbacteria bacterium]
MWQTYRDLNEDIYVQRILANGTRAPGWPVIGAPATRAAGDQYSQVIAPDGEGGAFVGWIDYRNVFTTGVDLYAQHLLGNGQIAPGWPEDGLPVCVANGTQADGELALVNDGAGGLFFAWGDGRPGASGIYAQHLNGDGTRVSGWPENGLAVSTAPEGDHRPFLASDGEGGVIVAWGRGSNATGSEVWAQRITWWGELTAGWPVNGKRVAPAAGTWAPSGMAPDGAGGAYIGWMHGYDVNFADADVYAIRILSDGSVAPGWASGGNPVAAVTGSQVLTNVVADSAGGVMLAWSDERNYPGVVYVARLLRDGSLAPGWLPNGNMVSDIPGYQASPLLAPDGGGGAYVAYVEAFDSHGYIQRVRAEGGLAAGWPTAGVALVNLDAAHQSHLRIVPDGFGGAIVVWEDFRNGIQDQIYAQRYFGDGPTPTLVSLVSVAALPDRVTIIWHRTEGALADAAVYRRREGGDWAAIGRATFDGTGRLEFEDRGVSPGARYAYRLGWIEDGSEQWSAETWVDVPAALSLALEGARPNPAVGELSVALTLPRAEPATLALLDMSGRERLVRDVGALGAGPHLVRLDEAGRTPPGVYWLRLTQAGQSLVKRAVVVR